MNFSKTVESDITVLALNYNHGKLLPRAIDSVISQTVWPGELLIIDDCSTDNSIEVIEAYQKDYPFIRLVKNEENLGGYKTKQKVHPLIKTKYVAGLAADDWLLSRYVEESMAMAKRYPKAAIIFGQMQMVDEHGKHMSYFGPSHWDQAAYISPEEYLRNFLFKESATMSLGGSTLIRNDLYLKNNGFLVYEDVIYDTLTYWVLALEHGACYVPTPFYAWRKHFSAMSASGGLDPAKIVRHVHGASCIMLEQFPQLFPLSFVSMWAESWMMQRMQQLVRRYADMHPGDRAGLSAFVDKVEELLRSSPGRRYVKASVVQSFIESARKQLVM